MIPICSASQVRALDDLAIRGAGVPGPVLMEQAGRLATGVLLDRLGAAARRGVLVLCGRGNNAGDGYVVARHLHLAGVPVRIRALSGRMSPEATLNRGICERVGVRFVEGWSLEGVGCIVDALVGTGLSAPLGGEVADLVERVNGSGLPVLSLDVPTGLDADRGTPFPSAVRATVTVTFGRLKTGFFLEPGPDWCGELVLADIGLAAGEALAPATRPEGVGEPGVTMQLVEASDVAGWLPVRAPGAHKGDAGRLALLAGSPEKTGAAVLAANTAARAGTGLVTLHLPRAAWSRLGSLRPEVMLEDPSQLDPARFDALVVGPGLGLAPETVALCRRLWAEAPVPALFDADGCNALAGVWAASRHPRLVTPHPGEAARLLGTTAAAIQADRLGAIRSLGALAPALLKGRYTLVSGAVPRVNPTGGPALATGGTGDVLSGLAGALLAQGLAPAAAAAAAAFLHGWAAEIAGPPPIVASDVLERIPEAWRRIRDRGPSVAQV
ncbi:MAG: NAD(P)H-hydrate dehydratase [Deltaproteobacteria bacterium]|nr:NAD(P)H-hydrate dehydratase [Deltaproteobacteria bacterium]